ncbi:MAG: RNA polymerase sigma factor [Candidatus Kapaibacterium sp.]
MFEEIGDSELIRQMKGSKSVKDGAFTEIYERYSSTVIAYCRNKLKDEELARDIFQETFIKFYKSIKPESNITNIPGYLIVIARNLCVNYFRDRKNKVPVQENTVITNGSDDNDSTEMINLIFKAVEYLDPKYRDVFIKREFDGKPYEVVAREMGITANNAKVRVIRAKKKIIEILTPYLKDMNK